MTFQDQIIITSNGKTRRKGWTIREKIGIAIVNPRGIAMGKKSVIIG